LAAFCTQLGWVRDADCDIWHPPVFEDRRVEAAWATDTLFNFTSRTFIMRMNWDPVMGVWMPFLKGDPDGPEVSVLRELIAGCPDWLLLRAMWEGEIDRFHDLAMYRRLGANKSRKRSVDGATTNAGQTQQLGAGGTGGGGAAGLLQEDAGGVGATEVSGAPAVRRNGFVRVGSVWVRESESSEALKAEAVVRKRKRR
jgi:hypothetical protein